MTQLAALSAVLLYGKINLMLVQSSTSVLIIHTSFGAIDEIPAQYHVVPVEKRKFIQEIISSRDVTPLAERAG